jgi:hypothetical protein
MKGGWCEPIEIAEAQSFELDNQEREWRIVLLVVMLAE